MILYWNNLGENMTNCINTFRLLHGCKIHVNDSMLCYSLIICTFFYFGFKIYAVMEQNMGIQCNQSKIKLYDIKAKARTITHSLKNFIPYFDCFYIVMRRTDV